MRNDNFWKFVSTANKTIGTFKTSRKMAFKFFSRLQGFQWKLQIRFMDVATLTEWNLWFEYQIKTIFSKFTIKSIIYLQNH